MAFNPFSTFRKYQKYWMAGAVLICMLTFVLCSGGMKGTGLDDVLIQMFGRHRGDFLFQANGRKYYADEINDLKDQRNIANDFMRELIKISIDRLTASIKEIEAPGELDEQRRVALSIKKTCLTDLVSKLNREPRYFHGGIKLDDLVDFVLWRDLANKYGVNTTDDLVRSFVINSCHGAFWGYDFDAEREARIKTRHAHYRASDDVILNALKQEYRVQIMQLALIARWSPGASGERDDYANIQFKDGRSIHLYLNTPMQARIAPTPQQIDAQYRKVRTELTIDLLPVSLEALAEKVKLPDDPKKRLDFLKKFYDENAKIPYNPNLDAPGFLFPEGAQIQFLTADAGMEYYKQPGRAVSLLEKAPPVAFNPLSPLVGELSWLATPPAWEASLQRNLDVERDPFKERWNSHYRVLVVLNDKYLSLTDDKEKANTKFTYDNLLNNPPPPYKDSASPWTTPYYYSPGQYNQALDKPNSETVAGLVGGFNAGPLAGWAAYQEGAFQAQAKKIAPMAALDRTKRVQVGGELFLALAPQFQGGGAFTAAALTYDAGVQPQFLPIGGYIEEQLQSKIEEQLAQDWVNAAMLDVKKQLEAVKGRPEEAFDPQVEKLMRKYSAEVAAKDGTKTTVRGLRFGETPDFRNEYDIEFDDNLKPLRDSFDKYRIAVNQIEGRGGKPDMLREGDFYKLLFGTEPLGVGPLEPRLPRIWPPYVTVPKWRESPLAQKSLEQRLFDTADKPIVFWKSDKRGSGPLEWRPYDPKMLAFVEKQYRLSEARAKDLPAEVKKIAEEVKRSQRSEGKDLSLTMRDLAKKAGTEVVTLTKVAMMVENPDRRAADPVNYVEYALPRGRLPFARADMVKQLLSLRGLTGPLKVDVEESDKPSKASGAEAAANRAKAELEELNKLNASLFAPELANDPKAKVGQVQVLTNKPRSVYYIATLVHAAEPSNYGYMIGDLLPQGLGKDSSQYPFVDQVQQDFSKELLRLVSQQLRSQAEVEITDQARKQFADEPLGQ